jgi:hypothetical protein
VKITLTTISFLISLICFSQQISLYKQFRLDSILPKNVEKFNSIDFEIQKGLDSLENRQFLPFSYEFNRYCYSVDFYDNGHGLFLDLEKIDDRSDYLLLTKNKKYDNIFGYAKHNGILVVFTLSKFKYNSYKNCSALISELIYNNLPTEAQNDIDENPDYIISNFNAYNLLRWPIDLDSNAIAYLTTLLNLNKVQTSFLFLNPKITNQLYYYTKDIPANEKKAKALLHINKLMKSSSYFKFIINHRENGDVKKVWWIDEVWLKNINFQLSAEALEIYNYSEKK